MKFNKLFACIGVASAILMSQVATASPIDKEADAPADGKALVYVVHADRFDAGNSIALVINGNYMGHMSAGSYAKKEVEPGKVELLSRGENMSTLDFVAKPNETYYVKKVVRPGDFQSRSYLMMADESEVNIAQTKISKGRLVSSDS
ncbi:MAG: hypothetical protein AAGJ37_05800 [Pseudomonadota bacterium]